MPTEQRHLFDSDGYALTGILHLPDTPNPPVVIGCHGLLANRNSEKQIALARACNRIGLAYFRFDHRGCGDSQGVFSEVTSLTARVSDIYHAVNAMQHHSATGPLAGLFGSSFGGTAVLAYAADNRHPALVTYAAPANSTSIDRSNIRDVNGRCLSSDLLTDALAFDIIPKLHTTGNILVAHSAGDETVPLEHARRIHAAVKEPKRLLIFENGDHRMRTARHQQLFETQFLAWLTRQDR